MVEVFVIQKFHIFSTYKNKNDWSLIGPTLPVTSETIIQRLYANFTTIYRKYISMQK